MGKNFLTNGDGTRIPNEFNGIQVNHCKNPFCDNFGKPAAVDAIKRGRPKKGFETNRDSYTLNNSRPDHPQLKCSICGKRTVIKSNQGISEELKRITPERIYRFLCCPDTECENNAIPVHFLSHYHKFGKTAKGDQRYKCRKCGKIFTNGKVIRRQKRSYKNREVFLNIVTKTPFRSLREVTGLTSKTLYRKIDFIHEQCLKFSSYREDKLKRMKFRQLNIATDRQDYVINWPNKFLKRNVVLQGVGSADNASGYVFAMNVNFDPALTLAELDEEIEKINDHKLKAPFRRYARMWTSHDYSKRLKFKPASSGSLDSTQSELKKLTLALEDVEPELLEVLPSSAQLPEYGVQIHSEYTMYAHFFYLKKLLGHTGQLNFYMDRETGINAALMAAFKNHFADRRANAFYVIFDKGLEDDQRVNYVLECKQKYKKFLASRGLKDSPDAAVQMALYNLSIMNPTTEEWEHPFGTKGEPHKKVVRIVPDYTESEEELAYQYLKGNLRGIDRFFNCIRRKLSPLERGIHTASGANGVWNGYAPYNPEMVQKYIDIYRTYYNYVPTPDKKETPAMRLKLADGPVSVEDIIYFSARYKHR
ncbi:hypothetical protein [Halodesulfovibrio sp.]|uniref:IS1/IS1595 family N-terminal zinc-binding domain-containing protein n=1 Tax=Halodesulfovibrio sp. TaxID=1912772 RepID=UPI0025B8F77A|nr:hypothetical protein [Halodesulfovibrio sp.]